MNRFEEVSLELPDGYRAYGRYWPCPDPRGAVLYHHGIQSHCGWYEASPARLLEAGYAVLQMDRRGSGCNRENLGHAESAQQLIQDSLEGRDELLRRSRLCRYHIVGVSWGGKLAVASYVTDPTGVESLSLVTPGLFPRIVASKETKAKIGFAMLYDRQSLFDIPLNDAELFTSAPRWQEFFKSDPLTLRQCTASFYLASRRMDRIVAKLATVKSAAGAVPVHLLVAGDEQIIHNDKTRQFVRELHRCVRRITTYLFARHSLEFEEDREAYFQDLVAFIDERKSETRA